MTGSDFPMKGLVGLAILGYRAIGCLLVACTGFLAMLISTIVLLFLLYNQR